MSKIKIYDFIDTETGDKFSGTKKELAAPCSNSYVKQLTHELEQGA